MATTVSGNLGQMQFDQQLKRGHVSLVVPVSETRSLGSCFGNNQQIFSNFL